MNTFINPLPVDNDNKSIIPAQSVWTITQSLPNDKIGVLVNGQWFSVRREWANHNLVRIEHLTQTK